MATLHGFNSCVTKGWTDGRMDGRTGGRADGPKDGRTNKSLDGHTLLKRCGNAKLVQESAFCTIMVRSTFYPYLISSKMITRKFHAPRSTANHHKCPLNYTLPNGGSNFQSDFFAILIADSDSWQKTAWRKYLSFFNLLKGSWSNKPKTKKYEGKLG